MSNRWGSLQSLSIPEFPVKPNIKGIGMSDAAIYAVPLEEKLGYTNTYYHKEPMIDITSIPAHMEETLDFIICTDVFEHIEPPVSHAFENARKLLKPNGVLIFTVPYNKEKRTKEHFPDLYKYEILKEDGFYILKNTTRDGIEQIFNNLIFHGGPGATLEMRYFSESSLTENLRDAGFANVVIYKEPVFEHGIYWDCDTSLPIAARIK